LNLSLNGDWRLVLDPEDRGVREQWYAGDVRPESLSVTVPGVWDLWAPDYDGVGWYYREFELEARWREGYVALAFEGVDYFAEAWLNGKALGSHEGGYTPFEFDATLAVQEGVNRLWVRVVDPHGPGGYGNFNSAEIPCAKENIYWPFAGMWGGVELESRSFCHFRDVFIEPDIRRKRIVVSVETSEAGVVRLHIEGTPHEVTGEPGTLRLDFPEHEPWAPETPVLYTLVCEVSQEGAVQDTRRIRFGMREFGVKENHFFLNGHPYFVKGALLQPDYPRALAAPETDAMARQELEAAKKAGFNLIRVHLRPAPRRTLELADELGMLVYEEPPIGWIKKSPWMQERCEREVREMILRDRNHPCIVIWGILNETGNRGYVTGGGAQTIKTELCELARSLDPSRLIIDDSGGVNATRERARMMRPYRTELEAYDDLHIYQRAPVDRDIELYYMHNGDPDGMYFLSEFGFGGMEDLPDVIEQYGDKKETAKDARFLQRMIDAAMPGFVERGLDRVFGSFSGMTAEARKLQADAVRYQVDACRWNTKLAGYVYTQLADSGHEFCAGLLDRWRRPKPVVQAFAEVQKPVRPLIQVTQTNLAPREEVPVTVTLANNLRLEGRADLSLQVVGPTNQVLWKKKRTVKIPRHGKELWTGTVGASGSQGTHKFVVRLIQGVTCIGENSVELHVLEPTEPSGVEINMLDPQNNWSARCLKLAKPGTLSDMVHIVPPLGNTIRAYPDNELAQILAQVKGGAVAIVFGPPDDWNDLAERLDPALMATSRDAVGAFMGAYHYVKLHPVFDGLPARGFMRQPYRNVIAPKTFLEASDEDICGTFNTAPASILAGEEDKSYWWGSDILVRRYGSGRVVFTHLRVLEQLGQDPVADRLFVNMLKHFSRRSVPSDAILPLDQKAVEWLRRERTDRIRRWQVIGPFPNWGGKGHDTAYPPETEYRADAIYPGWYTAIQWENWYSKADDEHVIDLQEAFTPVYEYYPRFDYGTGYAYAEFTCERKPLTLHLGTQNPTKVWVNGRLTLDVTEYAPHDKMLHESGAAMLKQGRNAILVKVSKTPGPFKFSLDFESATREPLQLKWWR